MPLPLAGKMPELELSGWHNGGGTFGLKVLGGLEERDRFLPLKARVEREGLDIVLPGEAGDVTVRVNVSETFGSTCRARIKGCVKREATYLCAEI